VVNATAGARPARYAGGVDRGNIVVVVTEIDYAALRDGLLRPARPHEERLRAALTRGEDPSTVWRTLAADEVREPDPRRRFLHAVPCGRCDAKGRVGGYSGDPDEWEEDAWSCSECRGTGAGPASWVDATPDQTHVLAVGAVPEAARAERLACETAARLVPWGGEPAERVVWRVGSVAAHRLGPITEGIPSAITVAIQDGLLVWKEELAGCADHVAIAPPREARALPYPHVDFQARMHARWSAAASRGLVVGPGRPLAGRAFADLPNPYTPLLEIWRTGFGLDRIADGVVTLYAAPC
jgi:hypothetical protein